MKKLINEHNATILAILVILIIQLFTSLSNEFRLDRLERKIDNYFAPIDDVPLPEWEEQK